MIIARIACLVLLPLALLAAGCSDSGRKFYPIQGTANFFSDGSAVQFGDIEFRSETDPPVIARGKIAKDGTFQLKAEGKNGTVAGKHKVIIIQVVGSPRQGFRLGTVVHDHGFDIAKKYSSYHTTDLTVEVTKENSKELVLRVEQKK